MTTEEITNFEVDGESIEVVQEFNVLGCTLTRNSDHTKEIRRRLMLGRKAMTNLTTIMKDIKYLDKNNRSIGISCCYIVK